MRVARVVAGSLAAVLLVGAERGLSSAPVQPPAATDLTTVDAQRAFVQTYCAGCHNDRVRSGGFSWTELDVARPHLNATRTEDVIRKVRAGLMPPAGARRPDAAALTAFSTALGTRIDELSAANPTYKAPELHRLNRREYRNAVRDLLQVDVDVSALLPPDARTGAFDNMADALTVNPGLMQAYVRAADKVARQALGDPRGAAGDDEVRRAEGREPDAAHRGHAARHPRRPRRHASLPRRRRLPLPERALLLLPG